MICPSCGPHGKMEQIAYSSEYEKYRCLVCGNLYVSYPIGHGEFSEPVPVINPRAHREPQPKHPES
jgi:uncharacterized Zn finger protein